MKELAKIPGQSQQTVNVLQSDTTVFSLFIPFKKLSPDTCPLPAEFLQRLKQQAELFAEKGMDYVFATDSQTMSEPQYRQLQGMLEGLGVDVLDVSTLDGYLPYYHGYSRARSDVDASSLYEGKVAYPKAEYIDKTKIMLANLAGREPYLDVLVTDFDIEFGTQKELAVLDGDTIAFTYTGRHEAPSTKFDSENSMIYVSQERPKTTTGEDLLEHSLKRIETVLESKGRMWIGGQYGCFAFSTLCHDPIVAQSLEQDGSTYLNDNVSRTLKHPYPGNNGSEQKRQALARQVTRRGNYLLHGDYYSPNGETWLNANKLSFVSFDEAKKVIEPPAPRGAATFEC